MGWSSKTRLFSRVVFGLAGLAAVSSSSFADQHVSSPFDFTLYTADVAQWRDGDRAGEVGDEQGAMATALANLLGGAESQVDIAIYGVEQQEWFFDQLSELKAKKVKVRAVVDQIHGFFGDWTPKNFTYPDTVRLPVVLGEKAVLPDLKPDGQPRIGSTMHNKFVVLDRKAVWLGTTNISNTCIGAEYNANTSILVKSPEVAKVYADEFDQMFVAKRTSVHKLPREKRDEFVFSDGTEVGIFFSPQDGPIENAILPFIRAAKQTLDIGMFFLTDNRIVAELGKAVKRGVQVRIIADAVASAQRHSRVGMLRKMGVQVRVENLGGKMHMKTAVADERHTLLGSMNWSMSGDHENDENTMVIRNNAKLGAELTAYFEDLWKNIPVVVHDGHIVDPRAESKMSINSCYDGIDNNHNHAFDQSDRGCR